MKYSQIEGRDPSVINADLHCHSIFSDGTLRPEELAERAHSEGVRVWALTDHDEIAGLEPARRVATELGLHFVPGVEISVTWASETVHIVGLNINPQSELLRARLCGLRSVRVERARAMAEGLAKVGITGSFEGALQYVSNPSSVSRTHFARFLVEKGVCETTREVFGSYLTPGHPGYVPTRWATLSDALSWIHEAGGVAVIAHPGRYRLTPLQLDCFIDDFKKLGGQGLEVVTGSHTVDQYRTFARRSLTSGLKASRGSDFHGPGESRVNLGELPPLPDGCVPIWDNWEVLY